MSSFDGGATWTNHQFLATGGDPMCAYDQFGNLFAGFMSPDLTEVDLLVSGDNGLHFRQIGRLRGIELNPAGATIDYCHVATGPGGFIAPGSVWMASSASPPPATPPNRVIFAKGAPVFGYVGLNFENIGAIGPFTGAQVAPPLGPTSNFTGIAVGPEGQVAVGYQNLDPSGNDIVVNTDTDGLGPNGFSPPVFVTHTAMLSFTPIPPLLQRSPDATTRVAYDNSPGPHHGRLYLSYADRPALGSSDTDVFLRWSDTDGANWSQAVRVNDDPGNNSQFFPNLAVDQSSGNVFLDWYDAREDLGVGGVGDLDRQRNTDVRVYGAVTLNGGLSFQTNFRISAGTTSANSIPDPNKLGDYIGITAYGGTFYAAWADNSGNLANNQDRPNPDIATARGYLLRVPGVTNLTGDRFELNNTSSTASQLGTLFTGQTVLDALSIYPADKDYFTFSTSFSGPLTITMDITSGRANEGDLDMRLYAVNGTSLVQIGASTRTGSAVQEQITTNVRAGQPLLLYVFGKTSATNAGTGLYRLTFDAP
jgi:hypothetical protein